MIKSIQKILAVAALCCAAAATAPAQNLVTNGGFETGDFTGWTVNDPSGFTNVGTNATGSSFNFAREGNSWANLGADPNSGSLSQTFTTVPGQEYTFSFSLATDITPPAAGNFFQALFNGVAVLTLNNNAESSYVDYNYTNLVASGTSTTIEFRYQHGDDYFRLDAVSVVPEPSTVSLLAITAFGGLAFVYRRSRRSGKAAP
jgi:hypothetical protein